MTLPVDVKKTTQYMNGQLVKYLPNFYKVEYTEQWGLDPRQNFHQAIGDLPLGIETIEAFYESDGGQMAALYDGIGDDVPIVDVEIGSKSYKAAIFVQGCAWNLMALEKERLAATLGMNIPSLNLVATKQRLVVEYFRRRENHTVLYGYPSKGIRGIFSLQDVTTSDATFTPYIKSGGAYTLDTAALYEDLIDIIYAFMARAKLSSPSQVSIKLPPRLGRRMVEIYKTTAGESIGLTLNQMLRSTDLGLGVASVEVHNELAGAELAKYVWNEAASGYHDPTYDRIVLKSANYNPTRHFYAPNQFAPFQRSTMNFEQVSLMSTTGILNHEPDKFWYYDFLNSQA